MKTLTLIAAVLLHAVLALRSNRLGLRALGGKVFGVSTPTVQGRGQWGLFARPRRIDQEAEAMGSSEKSQGTRVKKKKSRESQVSHQMTQSSPTSNEEPASSSKEESTSTENASGEDKDVELKKEESEPSTQEASALTSSSYKSREELFS